METVVARVPTVGSDVARFCFEGTVEQLHGQPAYYLLMALGMFPRSPQNEALTYVAGLNDMLKVNYPSTPRLD